MSLIPAFSLTLNWRQNWGVFPLGNWNSSPKIFNGEHVKILEYWIYSSPFRIIFFKLWLNYVSLCCIWQFIHPILRHIMLHEHTFELLIVASSKAFSLVKLCNNLKWNFSFETGCSELFMWPGEPLPCVTVSSMPVLQVPFCILVKCFVFALQFFPNMSLLRHLI